MPSPRTRRARHIRNDGVARRDDIFFYATARAAKIEWELIDASGQVVNWIRHGVQDKFKHRVRPRSFNQSLCKTQPIPVYNSFRPSSHVSKRAKRLSAHTTPCYVSRMFLVPKPGANLWRLIVDLRELITYCSNLNTTSETQALATLFPSMTLLRLPRPCGRLLRPRHQGGRPRLLHRQLPRRTLAARVPPDGLVGVSLPLLQDDT
jgi:hypothetical protein